MHMTGAKADEVQPLVKKYHYSKCMPSAIQHCFAWRAPGGLFGDSGEPLAAVIYSVPVNRNWPSDALELARLVRRDDFDGQLSTFVAWSLRWLRANGDYPFVLSYADTTHGHHGGIYQACGFTFVGTRESRHIGFWHGDTFIHGRSSNARLGTQSIDKVAQLKPEWKPAYGEPKHLYVFPLRQRLKAVCRRFGWQPLPYPKSHAARPADEPCPHGESQVQPLGAAPTYSETA